MVSIGDIYLVEGSGVVGKLISWWTRSRYTHGGIVVREGVGVSAKIKGIKEEILDGYKRVVYLTPKNPLSILEKESLQWFILKNYDRPYDWRAILGFIFFQNWQRNKEWYCFEFIHCAYEYAGRPLFRLDGPFVDGALIYSSNELIVIKEA